MNLNFTNIIVIAGGHIPLIMILSAVIIFMAACGSYYLFHKYRKEKIRTETLIRESILQERNQLRTLIDSMPDVIFIKDRQSRFVVVNKMVAGVMGTKPEALIGKDRF